VVPETRYARAGDVRVAYQVLGEGPRDLVLVPGFVSNLEVAWEYPPYERFISRLSAYGPARGIGCAQAICEQAQSLGIEVRAGLHSGEVDIRDGDVGGIAVHIGARVAGMASSGEVLVSGTVKDLVVGSGLEFTDRGTHSLKGAPGEWRLYKVGD
jgi:hypothetical protein